jgi:hypothetical protein
MTSANKALVSASSLSAHLQLLLQVMFSYTLQLLSTVQSSSTSCCQFCDIFSLPVDHFHLFAVLVNAITIFLSEPTHKDVDIVHVLCSILSKIMKPLYGARAMTINIHSL